MVRALIVVFTLFSFILPVHGQFPIIKHDSIVFVENTLKKVSKGVNFTIIPGPVDGPAQKIGFAVLPMLVYDLSKKDTLSPPSSTALLIYFDFYGSWIVAMKQSFYWNDNKWRAFLTMGAGNVQQKFFGIGRDTLILSNNASNYVWTHQEGGDISLSCYRKIYLGLYGGLEYRYNMNNFVGSNTTSDSILHESGIPVGKIQESAFVPSLVWDSRNDVYWTTKGFYATISFQFANNLFGSSKDYSVVAGWVNGYHSLLHRSNKLILAWHLYTQSGWGELPFIRYAIYGQGDEATGYTRGKYVDRSEVTLQAELRTEVWKFISMGVYGGTGKLFPSYNAFGKSVWLHFGGVRLYLNIIPSRNIRFMLDGALGRMDWGVYVGLGQAF